jgi:hypothetical protein
LGGLFSTTNTKTMKTTNALVAAALAGVFAAGTTLTQASQPVGAPVAAEKEKDDCPGKDKDKCPAKEKKELTYSNEKEKDDCPGKDKDKCPSKDKDKCPSKDKEKKEGAIL